jgi:hypothetical protein
MRRFFLSGQTTCALLLGAGLLLRVQSALNRAEMAQLSLQDMPRPRPAELLGERALRLERAERPAEARVQTDSHERKGFAHRERRSTRKCGVTIASRHFRCG